MELWQIVTLILLVLALVGLAAFVEHGPVLKKEQRELAVCIVSVMLICLIGWGVYSGIQHHNAQFRIYQNSLVHPRKDPCIVGGSGWACDLAMSRKIDDLQARMAALQGEIPPILQQQQAIISGSAEHPSTTVGVDLQAAEICAQEASDHSFDGHPHPLNGSIVLFKASLDAISRASEETNAKIDALHARVDALSTTAEIQILQQALTLAKYSSTAAAGRDDNDLIVDILESFMLGSGVWIPNEIAAEEPADRAALHDSLCARIHKLTGARPRIAKEKNEQGVEQHVIYRK